MTDELAIRVLRALAIVAAVPLIVDFIKSAGVCE